MNVMHFFRLLVHLVELQGISTKLLRYAASRRDLSGLGVRPDGIAPMHAVIAKLS